MIDTKNMDLLKEGAHLINYTAWLRLAIPVWREVFTPIDLLHQIGDS